MSASLLRFPFAASPAGYCLSPQQGQYVAPAGTFPPHPSHFDGAEIGLCAIISCLEAPAMPLIACSITLAGSSFADTLASMRAATRSSWFRTDMVFTMRAWLAQLVIANEQEARSRM